MISITEHNQRQAAYQERIERINQEWWLRTATTPLDRCASGISVFGTWLQRPLPIRPHVSETV